MVLPRVEPTTIAADGMVTDVGVHSTPMRLNRALAVPRDLRARIKFADGRLWVRSFIDVSTHH